MKTPTLLLLLLLAAAVSCWKFNNPYKQPILNAQTQDWLDQYIDHYNYASNATFKQKYFVLNDFYTQGGPAYLYICGEAPCNGVSNTSWLANIAKETKGIIFALEHRFYGESLPFGEKSLQTDNLKFLTSEQGLRDLAYFIQFVIKNKIGNVNDNTKWITVGGSYAGAMSAWFRSKYPHLTVGAIGSSGVVLAIEDFSAFDEQIYHSALKNGQECVDAILGANKYVEDKINGEDRVAFQASFAAQNLTAKEFLFYWADIIVFQFQYSRGVEFCSNITGKTTIDVVEIVKMLAIDSDRPINSNDYGADYLKNTTIPETGSPGGRAWIYQSCTQFSYFQTPSPTHPMRSALLSLDFYKQWCSNIFGEGTWPYVDRVNNQFGGLSLNASNLYLSNGDEDPWRWAGMQQSKGGIISRVYHCPNCGHCADLHTPKDSDGPQLVSVRAEELRSVKRWLEYADSKPEVTIVTQ